MALDVGAVLRAGLGRTVKPNGFILMGVFLLLGLASMVASQSLNVAVTARLNATNATTTDGLIANATDLTVGPTPLAAPIPLVPALVLVVLIAIVAETARIAAVRTLVSEETTTVPSEHVTRRTVPATANSIVGNLVVGVLILVGLVLLVIPGLFLAVSFFFVRQEIAVEDKTFVDAMADSWTLAAGNRLELLVLLAVVFLVGVLATAPTLLIGAQDPAAGALAGVIASAVTTVFGIAVGARAYDRLRAERTETVGALGPEDLEAPSS